MSDRSCAAPGRWARRSSRKPSLSIRAWVTSGAATTRLTRRFSPGWPRRCSVRRLGPAATMASTCSAGIVARNRNSSSDRRASKRAAARTAPAWRLDSPVRAHAAVLDPVAHVRIDRRRWRAEASEHVADHLVGHVRVALLADHVHHRLRADDLRERRHHDRVAQLARERARPRRRPRADGAPGASRASWRRIVADHAAGQLVLEVARVVFLRRARRQAFGGGEPAEVAADCPDQRSMSRCRREMPLLRRLATVRSRSPAGCCRCPAGARRYAPCRHPAPARRIGERRQADRAVRVQLQRLAAEGRAQRGQQRAGALRRQQAARVLQVDTRDVRDRSQLARRRRRSARRRASG